MNNCLREYANYLEENLIFEEFPIGTYSIEDNHLEYSLEYINSDDIPELVILKEEVCGVSNVCILSYVKGEIKKYCPSTIYSSSLKYYDGVIVLNDASFGYAEYQYILFTDDGNQENIAYALYNQSEDVSQEDCFELKGQNVNRETFLKEICYCDALNNLGCTAGYNCHELTNQIVTSFKDGSFCENQKSYFDMRDYFRKRFEDINVMDENYNNILNGSLDEEEKAEAIQAKYSLWDDELNSLWKMVKEEMDANAYDSELKKQRIWNDEKEREVALMKEVLQDTNQDFWVTKKLVDITKRRCYVLADDICKNMFVDK